LLRVEKAATELPVSGAKAAAAVVDFFG